MRHGGDAPTPHHWRGDSQQRSARLANEREQCDGWRAVRRFEAPIVRHANHGWTAGHGKPFHPDMKLRRKNCLLIRSDRSLGRVRASRRAHAGATSRLAMAPVRLCGRGGWGTMVTAQPLHMHRAIGRAPVGTGLARKSTRMRGAGSEDDHEHERHYPGTSMSPRRHGTHGTSHSPTDQQGGGSPGG